MVCLNEAFTCMQWRLNPQQHTDVVRLSDSDCVAQLPEHVNGGGPSPDSTVRSCSDDVKVNVAPIVDTMNKDPHSL